MPTLFTEFSHVCMEILSGLWSSANSIFSISSMKFVQTAKNLPKIYFICLQISQKASKLRVETYIPY
jgi:hypothetical protein